MSAKFNFFILSFLLLVSEFKFFGNGAILPKHNGDTFCYDDTKPCGPSNWGGICNGGNSGRQTPIDVTNFENGGNPDYKFRMSSGYSQPFTSFYLQNNAHTIELSFSEEESSRLRISYKESPSSADFYNFHAAHFHWGENSNAGSEHTLNGSSSAMEIHFVHYSARYPSLSAAAAATDDPHSLSVLGVLVNVCKAYEVSAFSQIAPFVAGIGVSISDERTKINGIFSLVPLLPKFSLAHYSYSGSLTTPGCSEVVQWTLLKERVCIRENELQELRKIKTTGGGQLVKNDRPIQPIGNRVVTFYS